MKGLSSVGRGPHNLSDFSVNAHTCEQLKKTRSWRHCPSHRGDDSCPGAVVSFSAGAAGGSGAAACAAAFVGAGCCWLFGEPCGCFDEVAVDGESRGFGTERGAGGALLFRGIVQRAVAAFDCGRRYCAGGIGDADGAEQGGDFVRKFSGPDSGFSGVGAADGGWGGSGSGKFERGEPAFVFCLGRGGFGIGDHWIACDRVVAGAAIFVSHAAKIGAIERGAAGDG